jgi:hypothetical protein
MLSRVSEKIGDGRGVTSVQTLLGFFTEGRSILSFVAIRTGGVGGSV